MHGLTPDMVSSAIDPKAISNGDLKIQNRV
jgi:hypothetical protein